MSHFLELHYFLLPFLSVSQEIIIISILFMWVIADSEKGTPTSALVLLGTILTFFLKSIFQVPLPPPLHGYGFPSGHTVANTLLYLSFMKRYKQIFWLKIVIPFLLLGIWVMLVCYGFHYPIDVIGGVGLSLALLCLQSLLEKKIKEPWKVYTVYLFIVSICLLGIASIPFYVIRACLFLLGLTCSTFFLAKNICLSKEIFPVLSLCAVTIFIGGLLLVKIPSKEIVSLMLYFFLGALMPLVQKVSEAVTTGMKLLLSR